MENVRLSLRQSRKFGKEIDPESKFGLLSCSVTSCSGSGYGSGFSNTAFTTENSAVFAPIQLRTRIMHIWQRYDEAAKSWRTQAVVAYPITGGRDDTSPARSST